jgi:hypothetical protein
MKNMLFRVSLWSKYLILKLHFIIGLMSETVIKWLPTILQLGCVWLEICSLIYGLYNYVDLRSNCVTALNRITILVYISLTFVKVLYYVQNPMKTCPFIT